MLLINYKLKNIFGMIEYINFFLGHIPIINQLKEYCKVLLVLG